MSETVIGLFPDNHEAQEFVPMLTNRGYGRDDVEIIGGQGWTTSETGSDLTDKLSQLGMADAEQSPTWMRWATAGRSLPRRRQMDARRSS